jgi:hypothetical protein
MCSAAIVLPSQRSAGLEQFDGHVSALSLFTFHIHCLFFCICLAFIYFPFNGAPFFYIPLSRPHMPELFARVYHVH